MLGREDQSSRNYYNFINKITSAAQPFAIVCVQGSGPQFVQAII